MRLETLIRRAHDGLQARTGCFRHICNCVNPYSGPAWHQAQGQAPHSPYVIASCRYVMTRYMDNLHGVKL